MFLNNFKGIKGLQGKQSISNLAGIFIFISYFVENITAVPSQTFRYKIHYFFRQESQALKCHTHTHTA